MPWQDQNFSVSSRVAASRQDDDFNDVAFLVNGELVKANSIFLAMASTVWKTRLLTYEKDQKIIPINDAVTARSFKAMVNFIYKEGGYSIGDLLNGNQVIILSDDLSLVMELLFIGTIYQINSLIIFCRNILIHKLEVTRGNMWSMSEVMRKYAFLGVYYQIVAAQIKAAESAIVDIFLFHDINLGGTNGSSQRHFQIKFKINQDALFLFNIEKQHTDFFEACDDHKFHASHYRSISWEPENGPKETALGRQLDKSKFLAEKNVEITLGITMMCHGFGIHGFVEWSPRGAERILPRDGKFLSLDFEVEILEVNGKVYEDALESREHIPLAVLSFQPLTRVI